MLFLTKLYKLSPNCCWHNARYTCYTCCGIVYAAHMGAVLWSAVLHAMLYATQPLQPLQYVDSSKTLKSYDLSSTG